MRILRLAGVAVLLLLAIPAAIVCTPALAQTPQPADERVNLLAVAELAPGQTTVVIAIPPDKGRVRALHLVATTAGVTILRATVAYSNGQVHFEDRGEPVRLARDRQSDEIDRRREERFVDRVELVVERQDAPARIEVWAHQSASGAVARRGGEAAPRTRSPTARGFEAPSPRASGPPEPSPRSGPTGPSPRSGPATPREACQPGVCAEVVVHFGTDREQEKPASGANRVFFGGTPGTALTLGRSFVSIPTNNLRKPGDWSRPDVDFIVWTLRRQEHKERDFTILGVETLAPDAFRASLRKELARKPGKRVLLFVHGYNVSFDDAMFRTAQIAHDTGFDGLVAGYSWPSKANVFSYTADVRSAFNAARRLQEFIELVAAGTDGAELHLVAHSMGSNPLLHALHAAVRAQPRGLRLGEVIMAAPDVVRRDFVDLTQAVRQAARGLTVYASENDRALQASNALNDLPAGLVRGEPFVVAGVQTIDISRLNTDVFALNHSTFATHADLVNDIARLFAGGPRLPHDRNSAFRQLPVKSPQGEFFWRYAR